MFEMKNWNGHRVLAIPTSMRAALDPVVRAYETAAKSLAEDLGAIPSWRPCRLCPMRQTDAEKGAHRCAHPQGFSWAAQQDVDKGGCFLRIIVAEEYIPLVKIRLPVQDPNR